MIVDFYLIATLKSEQILNNMLKNVTKRYKITQLLSFKGFIIHVDTFSVGEKAYA